MDASALLAEMPRLRRYARAMLGDRAAADDLVQDTLERAWSRSSQWRPGSDLRAWLFGIMHNLRVDQLRRARVTTEPIDEETCLISSRPTQTDALEVMDLESALRQLPDEQREVLLLVAVEAMSYADIAGVLHIPLGTVMSRLSRGRERLRQVIAGSHGGAAGLRVVR